MHNNYSIADSVAPQYPQALCIGLDGIYLFEARHCNVASCNLCRLILWNL